MVTRQECSAFGALVFNDDANSYELPEGFVWLVLYAKGDRSGYSLLVRVAQTADMAEYMGSLVAIRGYAILDDGDTLQSIEPHKISVLTDSTGLLEGVRYGHLPRLDRYFPPEPALEDAPEGVRLVNDTLPGATYARVGDWITITYEVASGTPQIALDPTPTTSAVMPRVSKTRRASPGGGGIATLKTQIQTAGTIPITFKRTDAVAGEETEVVATLTTIAEQRQVNGYSIG